MFKIALNAGHGRNTAGKRCMRAIDPNETREWVLNARICDKIQAKLKAYSGYELIRLDDTTGNTDVPLKTRTDKANKFGADFYLAIHHNSGVNGTSGGGLETYTYFDNKIDQNTRDWQAALYNACIAHTGLKGNRSNGVRHADFHEVRESHMAAVLIECGFMDSTVDTPIILTDAFAEQIADACVEVLVARGGLTKGGAPQPAPTPTPTPQPAPAPAPAPTGKTTPTYQVWDDVKNKWLSNVVGAAGYAGIYGHDVCAVYISCDNCNVYYQVHSSYKHEGKVIGWLPAVTNRQDYAGIFNKPIDAIRISCDKELMYKVHLRRKNKWLPAVSTRTSSLKDPENGWAGIIGNGNEIDAIVIWQA